MNAFFDMKKLKIYNHISKYGFSFYRNSIVVWDEDFDERVLEAIDYLESQGYRIDHTAFFESKGTLSIITEHKAYAPLDGTSIDIDIDSWLVTVYL